MSLIVGIDTGVSGGMALFDNITMTLVDCREVPNYWQTMKTKTKKGNLKKRRRLSYYVVADILGEWYGMGAREIIIEKVGAMPTDSGIAAFSFGEAYGCFNGIAAAMGFNIHHVTPQQWKREAGLIGEDKEASLERAKHLFGVDHFKLKKDHNKAEAALIACSGFHHDENCTMAR